MLKPTRRKNGKHMVTVRVTHHLFRNEVVRVIAHNLLAEDEPVTKASVEKAVRDQLLFNPDKIDWFADDYSDDEDEWEDLLDRADEALTKLYPDWVE